MQRIVCQCVTAPVRVSAVQCATHFPLRSVLSPRRKDGAQGKMFRVFSLAGVPFRKLSAKIASFKFYRVSFRRLRSPMVDFWRRSRLTSQNERVQLQGEAIRQLFPNTNIIFSRTLLRRFQHSFSGLHDHHLKLSS